MMQVYDFNNNLGIGLVDSYLTMNNHNFFLYIHIYCQPYDG